MDIFTLELIHFGGYIRYFLMSMSLFTRGHQLNVAAFHLSDLVSRLMANWLADRSTKWFASHRVHPTTSVAGGVGK